MNINWIAKGELAAKMKDAELVWALKDCVETAEAMDAVERKHGATLRGKDAGYYRDEASIYEAELRRRGVPVPIRKAVV